MSKMKMALQTEDNNLQVLHAHLAQQSFLGFWQKDLLFFFDFLIYCPAFTPFFQSYDVGAFDSQETDEKETKRE